MLHGFFDDSGKESESANRIVCIGGYVSGSAQVWNGLAELWKNFLLKHDLEWLHMKDFMCEDSSEYAYLGWDWPKKRAVLEDFSSAIKISQIIGFGVAVDADGWRQLPPEFVKKHGTCQEFCFTLILQMVVERMKRSTPDERISILFDCDRGFTPARFQRYLRFRDNVPDADRFLCGFTVGEPKVFLPLQAADLLAWEVRKDVMRRISGFESRPEFQHLMMVLPGFFPDYTLRFLGADDLKFMLDEMDKTPRL
jgi:hypothetical protein